MGDTTWANEAFKPPPDLTVSTWADAHRFLSSESSAEPGRWKTSRAPYQKEIMDALTDPMKPWVVWMSSTQVGKTELLNNFVGFCIDVDPAPMLLIEPTVDIARAWSKDRLSTMLRDTPRLAGKVKDVRGAAAMDDVQTNTALHKTFPGGHITIGGSNSAATFASRPIRIFIGDDLDRWTPAAGEEGDQVLLGEKRTTTFWNRKIILCSTPGTKELSRIEKYYKQSDMRKYWIPCPHCFEMQVLKWRRMEWDKEGDEHLPETVRYLCEFCGERIYEHHKEWMLTNGEWRKEFQGETKIAGFWIWEAYSPWKTWAELVRTFLRAESTGSEGIKAFINTSLAETYEEKGDAPEWEVLMKRAEDRPQWVVPSTAWFLTASVDVQDDRLECSMYAWGKDEESWMVGHAILYGSPDGDDVWNALDLHLGMPRIQEHTGRKLYPLVTTVDSGYKTQRVYWYCRIRPSCYATKGSSESTSVAVGRPSMQDVTHDGVVIKDGVRLWMIGTHVLKSTFYNRLKLSEYGPRYVHYPAGLDTEFYQQLTAEKLITRYTRGYGKPEWHKLRARNEALDLAVGNYAAAIIAGMERLQVPTSTIPHVSSNTLKKPEDTLLSRDSQEIQEEPPPPLEVPAGFKPLVSNKGWGPVKRRGVRSRL